MSEITFSVCVPNYNYDQYLEETIRSALNQDYENLELIVADNASTDRSIDIVERINDSRVRLIKNRYNIGFAPNLQRATESAVGEFIHLLSSDDIIKSGALSNYAAIIQKYHEHKKNLVLVSDVDRINSDGEITGLHPVHQYLQTHGKRESITIKEKQIWYRQLDGHSILRQVLPELRTFAPFVSIVYSRDLYNRVEGYNAVRTIGPDKFFNNKLLKENPIVIYVEEPQFQWRLHGSANQIAQNLSVKQQIDDYLNTIEENETFLKQLQVSKIDLINTYLDRVCFKNALKHFGQGSLLQACRLFFFGLATYPLESLKRKNFYSLIGLFITSPISRPLIRVLMKIWKK